jgi:3-dehydroquinate synthase
LETVCVHGENGYPVHIGGCILGKVLPGLLEGSARVMIATDSNVAPLWLRAAVGAARSGREVRTVVLRSGEDLKSAANLRTLWAALAGGGFTRQDRLVALGGGTVGDLCGFAAGTYMRGIGLIQIPTTLLACADSSVGGKSAVDLPGYKNICGLIRRPEAVLCDTQFLSTLPAAEYASGMAEIIKYSLVCRPGLTEALGSGKPDPGLLIRESVLAKKEFVEADEFDTGARMALNFGHTVAHAAESLSGFSVRHGEAVAAGMCTVLRAEAAAGLCRPDLPALAERLCLSYGLPVRPEGPGAAELAAAMASDKKATDGGVRMVLLSDIGRPYVREFSPDDLAGFIAGGL